MNGRREGERKVGWRRRKERKEGWRDKKGREVMGGWREMGEKGREKRKSGLSFVFPLPPLHSRFFSSHFFFFSPFHSQFGRRRRRRGEFKFILFFTLIYIVINLFLISSLILHTLNFSLIPISS